MTSLGSIVIGAQYYRPPNPPRSDWERDLQLMANSGMNTVKFWACWSWMNPERDHFDFEDLDALMEIAGRVGLKVVLNVILEDAPYWLEEDHPEARYCDADGRDIQLGAAMNTPGGGWPGLCFDNAAVAEAGFVFLEAVVARYKDHPTLLAWDVWNEPHLEPASYFPDRIYCYCAASTSRFRRWLQLRYKTLQTLNARWARRFSGWSQVHPPRLFEAVPDMMDWREFWFENLRAWLDARVARIKALGAAQPAMTHVALSGFTGQMATHTLDEWTLAPAVDGFGTSSFPTWLMNDDPVEHLMSLDAARAAAAGKPFWQSELQGGRGRRNGASSTQHPRREVLTLEMWNAFAAGRAASCSGNGAPNCWAPNCRDTDCAPPMDLLPRERAPPRTSQRWRSARLNFQAPRRRRRQSALLSLGARQSMPSQPTDQWISTVEASWALIDCWLTPICRSSWCTKTKSNGSTCPRIYACCIIQCQR